MQFKVLQYDESMVGQGLALVTVVTKQPQLYNFAHKGPNHLLPIHNPTQLQEKYYSNGF